MKKLNPNQFLDKSGLTVGQILKACSFARQTVSKMSEKDRQSLVSKARKTI